MNKQRILIADDHQVVAEGLRQLLEPEFEVVGIVADGRELLAAAKKLKPSVIWLHFQECTGCTESLLRTSHPAVSELILDLVSLDYCETLFAAARDHPDDDGVPTTVLWTAIDRQDRRRPPAGGQPTVKE